MEFVKVHPIVIVLVQTLEQKPQVLLCRVQILLLYELTQVVQVKVALLLAIQGLEGLLG